MDTKLADEPHLLAPSSVSDHIFEPSHYLLGLLQKMWDSGQACRFRYKKLPPLYVSPEENRCFMPALDIHQSESTHKRLYTLPTQQIEQTALSMDDLQMEVKKNNLRTYPIETALWQGALYASFGRLLASEDKQRFIRLKHWPNFTILPHYPSHIQLAAFMLRNAANRETIAAKTQTTLAMVIDFSNACQTISLLVEETTPRLDSNKEVSEPTRHLFKDILKRLLYE